MQSLNTDITHSHTIKSTRKSQHFSFCHDLQDERTLVVVTWTHFHICKKTHPLPPNNKTDAGVQKHIAFHAYVALPSATSTEQHRCWSPETHTFSCLRCIAIRYLHRTTQMLESRDTYLFVLTLHAVQVFLPLSHSLLVSLQLLQGKHIPFCAYTACCPGPSLSWPQPSGKSSAPLRETHTFSCLRHMLSRSFSLLATAFW